MRLLHLEDDPTDALLIQRAIKRAELNADVVQVNSAKAFCDALEQDRFDAVIVDHGVPGFNAQEAVKYSQQHQTVPVIVCSGGIQPEEVAARLAEGATDYILKDQLWQLVARLRHIEHDRQLQQHANHMELHNQAMYRLLEVVQQLSLARDLPTIMDIVRHAARDLTQADGATFVLRDNEQCFYAEEDAISPLWKGQRFPLSACVSGWVMTHSESIAIEDIYADPRVPVDAYRPTFVKSLAMVPIRRNNPLGAIGNYWARRHQPTPEQIRLLEALANTTAVAIENVQLYSQLEQRVQQRTRELQEANRELEAYSYAISHDLRAPLRAINGHLQILLEDFGGALNAEAKRCIDDAQGSARHMSMLITDLLRLSHVNQASLRRESIHLSELVRDSVERCRAQHPDRIVELHIDNGVTASGDRGLIGVAIDNLVSNAFKYSSTRAIVKIEFGVLHDTTPVTYFIKDNGVGFEMQYADKLFQPFQRLHHQSQFPGTGIGLATVRRIIERHDGDIWAQAAPDAGATFYFTLPSPTDVVVKNTA